MQHQHTPGPWIIEAETCHTGDIATVHNTAEKWVTIYAPHWMETGMGEHEQSANARLIAAAPELLEALKAMLEVHGVRQEHANASVEIPQSWVDLSDVARTAIAKATGGEV